jgi:MerR family transcriptional regulator, heat shock protein HspR
MTAKRSGKAYYMISAVAQKYNIHPQTLRLYEREGLLKPSRTEGNTRLYSEEDLEQLETILSLTRDLGVNLAGVEIILNMRRKIEAMQHEVNEFIDYVKRELSRGIGDWEQRLSTGQVLADRPCPFIRAADPHRSPRRARQPRRAATQGVILPPEGGTRTILLIFRRRAEDPKICHARRTRRSRCAACVPPGHLEAAATDPSRRT